METAVKENSESASSRLGVCPQVVALDIAGLKPACSCAFLQYVRKDYNCVPPYYTMSTSRSERV